MVQKIKAMEQEGKDLDHESEKELIVQVGKGWKWTQDIVNIEIVESVNIEIIEQNEKQEDITEKDREAEKEIIVGLPKKNIMMTEKDIDKSYTD